MTAEACFKLIPLLGSDAEIFFGVYVYQITISINLVISTLCRLDIGDGKELDLKECPRSKLQKERIKYLGPVCPSMN